MALTQEKLDAIVRYATEQITNIIENGDIYDENNTQRMFLAVQQIYDELGAIASEQIPEMLQQAYIDGVANAIKQLGQLGIGALTSNEKIGDIVQAPLHTEAISNIVSDTLGDLSAAFRTAEKYSIKNIDLAIDEVKQEIANGMIVGMTDKQIGKRVGQKFGRRGMTAFVTKDGKHLPLDFYANAVTQTKIQTATNHGHLNRYEEMDVKHVIVTGNVPTCHECARYRGIVFSTKRGDPDFPHIDLYKTFPKHPHCRCNFRPYIAKFKSKEQLEQDKANARQFNPDKDPRSENEKKRYDAEQKAKAKARRKRHTFNKLKAVLGDDGPQSFTEFKNADKWQRNKWIAQLKQLYNPNNQIVEDDTSTKDHTSNRHLTDVKDHANSKDDTKINEKDSNNDDDNVKIEVDTDGDYLTVQNRYTKELMKHMTDDEKGILHAYTTDYYYDINQYLLNEQQGIREEWQQDVEEDVYKIDNIFKKYDVRTLKDTTLYRGISEEEFRYIVNNFKEQDGQFFYTTETYKSTSSDESATDFFGEANKIEFRLPKGARAMSLVPLSQLEDEQETLINVGQTFKLVSFDEVTKRLILEWTGE